ncbi:hypothetical protein CEY00_Acc15580 [Actinidia chinensis var. chinensis]|uniref:Uncharacterized protein n=1 Tax=Actinidia chinensis var. chinensis TaxID=1590841 RepID=A0A2R6QN06_ACTCC|nr:hypothetical protein CEY00_Acc15580 [Actinidia chinensis var. chinensis]
MPRSSRHKSHKHSKNSSRDDREHSESEEDVKMKDRNGKEEGSVRVSKDSGSIEKRKLSLGKDPSVHSNGGTAEEYVASKRRKEKADVDADRWNGGGDERGHGATATKEVKGETSRIDADKNPKLKAVGESKSKSCRRHESGSEKKDDNVGEREETKSTIRVDSKRKSEKVSGQKEVQQSKDLKESKDRERGLEREKKIHDIKRETESTVDDELVRKKGSHLADCGEEQKGKRGREKNEGSKDGFQNPELEKEPEKRMRRKRDDSSDKDKYQDDVKENADGRLPSRGERSKDGRYKDEKHKDGSYGDKHREDGDRGTKHRDDMYREDAERESKHRDVKFREECERDYRHRDNKYREDRERDNRYKDDKYHEDGSRDNRPRDAKYLEDGDKDIRHREAKYREGGDRDNRHREDNCHEGGDKDSSHRDDKYHDDGEREKRRRDDRYLEDGNRNSKPTEEKNWEDIDRDSRYREGMQRDDKAKDKRLRDANYWDERSSRDRTSDKSNIKHLRGESAATELHHRKSSNRDGSPIFDERNSLYKDGKGRRRTSDKEDYGEIRSQSTKEQHSEAEKKSFSSARVELVSDRGRSNLRNTDVEPALNNSRRRGSPSTSSHAVKDHYRLAKQQESEYRDYGHEEGTRHNSTSRKEYVSVSGVTEKASLSRPIEKSLQKDDSHLGEVSAARRTREDASLQVVDKSPSSANTERRHLSRSNVRRNLDIEDSGQRSGGSRDARAHSGREGRGFRELPTDTLPCDELSQADGDNLSVSSPFSRTNHLSSNSRTLLPPPPSFRMGSESPQVLGSFEDDNRGKPSSRHRRIGDLGMGRVQSSAWRGVPNWPPPVANGFIPFQHGPPPTGFHPVMQQFPSPPMFSVRPSMELNQSGIPYHVPDGDRFSGRGRPLGWRTPMDDSCPPPLHGWGTNNAVFGDDPHVYGRLNWDHNRSLTSGRVWETSSGSKGHNCGASTELPSSPKKDDYSTCGPEDEVWSGKSGLQPQNDKKQSSAEVQSINIDQSSNALERNILEAPKTIPEEIPNLSRKDDTHLSHLYLSMLDISLDLTQPELYSQYTNLMGMDQNTLSEEDNYKFILTEEAIDATAKISTKATSASLFPSMDDSVLQKAMSLYKNLREEVWAISRDKILFSNAEILKSATTLNQDRTGSNDKPAEAVPNCDQPEVVRVASASNEVKMEVSLEDTNDMIDEPVLADSQENSEVAIAALNEVKMELDLVPNKGTLDSIVEEKSSSPENVDRSDANSPGKTEEVNGASDSKGNCSAANDEGQKSHDAKSGVLLFSDMSAEACEAVMPVESGSVNLNRIHQSPESTH